MNALTVNVAKTFVYSVFNSLTDNKPQHVTATWSEICETFSTHVVREAKEGKAFSPAEYADGKLRSNNNVLRLNFIALDLDNGNIAAARAYCDARGWAYVICTTWSHTVGKQCYRVLIQPSRPILPQEWPIVWAALYHEMGGLADVKTRDAAHIFFMPSCPQRSAGDKFVHVGDGTTPADVDALIAMNPPPVPSNTKKGSKSSSAKTIREMAEEVLIKHYSGLLWYYHESFREYHEGHWRQLDEKIDVTKAIMTEYPELAGQHAKEVTETLKLLTAGRKVESDYRGDESDRGVSQVICLSNGTLDPVTGVLHPHSPTPRLLTALKLVWSPDAMAPRFMQFLEEIWGKEPDFQQRVDFLQEFMGYILYPSNEFERFLWLTGAGANGKSVLLEIMAAMAGPENTTHVHLDRLGRPAVRATLEGKMLNISSEMNAGSTLADGNLKSITSGETMDAERKFKDPFSFRPTVKLVAATNILPHLKDTSGGFARRAVILSFNKVFADHERDVDLKRKLLEELPGILVWAVKGLQRLLAHGKFVPPASSEKLVADYRTESDSVALFNQECLMPCQKGTPVGDLYAEYREFCATGGFCPTNRSVFGKRLMDLGIGMLKKSMGKPIRAARLRTAADNDEAVSVVDTNPDEKASIGRNRTRVSFDEMFGSLECEPASNEATEKAAA